MEMGGHIQRREELRAEGKLKKVIDSILKKARVHLDLSCFVDADGILQTGLEQGHNKLTEDFAAWYNTPLGHVDNEALLQNRGKKSVKAERYICTICLPRQYLRICKTSFGKQLCTHLDVRRSAARLRRCLR